MDDVGMNLPLRRTHPEEQMTMTMIQMTKTSSTMGRADAGEYETVMCQRFHARDKGKRKRRNSRVSKIGQE